MNYGYVMEFLSGAGGPGCFVILAEPTRLEIRLFCIRYVGFVVMLMFLSLVRTVTFFFLTLSLILLQM